jgi:glycosyltransferase involved in cell wall biosynthesis
MGEAVSKLTTWSHVWRCLRERRDRIIHLHLEIKYTPYLIRLAGCARLVYSIHSDLPMFQRAEWRVRLRVLNRLVSYYIAISERVRSYFLEVSGARPEKVITVRYGFELPSETIVTRREHDIPDGAFVVGFVGRLTCQKNLFVFLDALQRRSDILGIIVGDGDQRDELRSYAEERRIANVRFLGPVPNAYRLMPLFDVFCLPSLWEGFGLVLLEAMLSRVPIIASSRGAIPEILAQGKYGLLFEPNVDDLVRAIDMAMNARELLCEQAEAAQEYAKREFGVERMTLQTISVYGQILGAMHSGPSAISR